MGCCLHHEVEGDDGEPCANGAGEGSALVAPRLPAHGEVRNWRLERETKTETFRTKDTGEEFSIPIVSVTRSASERYCAGCAKWVEVKGIFGAIEWDIEHGGHGTKGR